MEKEIIITNENPPQTESVILTEASVGKLSLDKIKHFLEVHNGGDLIHRLRLKYQTFDYIMKKYINSVIHNKVTYEMSKLYEKTYDDLFSLAKTVIK